MINQEIVRKLAQGDPDTVQEVMGLPTPLSMAYGHAVEELRRKESIVPVENGMNLYLQPKVQITDDDGVAKAYREMLDERNAREAEAERIRNEVLEKEIQQRVERARALGSYQ